MFCGQNEYAFSAPHNFGPPLHVLTNLRTALSHLALQSLLQSVKGHEHCHSVFSGVLWVSGFAAKSSTIFRNSGAFPKSVQSQSSAPQSVFLHVFACTSTCALMSRMLEQHVCINGSCRMVSGTFYLSSAQCLVVYYDTSPLRASTSSQSQANTARYSEQFRNSKRQALYGSRPFDPLMTTPPSHAARMASCFDTTS